MDNSSLFATFASQMFAALHNSFPVPIALPRKEIVGSVESHDEFWKLEREVSTVRDIAEIIETTGHMTPDLRDKAQQKQSELGLQLEKKREQLRRMELVFDGTVTFLVGEGFVRSFEDGTYQLTLKGFSHLNKRFEQGTIQDGTSLIERLLDALRPEKFSGSVTTGALAAIVAKVFGG